MSPVDESVFFPPLEKCLDGDHPLLSWKHIYESLCYVDIARRSRALQAFLSDSRSLEILEKPWDPFGKPSSASKSSFDTKTAAINITPSNSAAYDINEIKEDTVWLSEETNTNEIDALRVVILEWQERPGLQLLNGFTEEEVLSIQHAAGSGRPGASKSGPSMLAASFETESFFASKEQRRRRTLSIYYSERAHVARTSEILIRLRTEPATAEPISQDPWLKSVGEDLFSRQRGSAKSSDNHTAVLTECATALKSRITGFANGSGLSENENGNVLAEDEWCRWTFIEMIHILQLMLVHLDASPNIPAASTVTSWFQFLKDWKFFQAIELVGPSMQAISLFQVLIAIVSLEFLKLPLASDYIRASVDERSEAVNGAEPGYLSSAESIERLHGILMEATEFGPSPATLAIFAWTLIVKDIAEVAMTSSLFEDDQNSPDNDPVPKSLSSTRNPAVAVFDDAWRRMSENEDCLGILSRASVGNRRTFSVISMLSENISSLFGAGVDYSLQQLLRLKLFNLLRSGVALVQYTEEVIVAALSVLLGDHNYWSIGTSCGSAGDHVMQVFLQDSETDALMLYLLDQAQSRYPYETLPLLKISRTLALSSEADDEGMPYMARSLQENIEVFTQRMPAGFTGFDVEEPLDDEPSSDSIHLTQDLPLFWSLAAARSRYRPGRELALATSSGALGSFVIPRGTRGNVIVQGKPPQLPHTTTWSFKHSALQYFAASLATAIYGNHLVEYSSKQPATVDDASEIVGLFATLIASAVQKSNATNHEVDGKRAAEQLLEDANAVFAGETDLITIIFTLFEQELQKQVESPGADRSLELLVHCVQFFHALVGVLPAKIWPFLSRSCLLEIDGKGGCLSSIIIATEMVVGRYDLLISCIHLFEALVDDVIANAVVRKSTPSKAITRFASNSTATSGLSEKSMSKILMSLIRLFTGIFESAPAWRFEKIEQKLDLNTRLAGTFSRIITCVFGYDDVSGQSGKIVGALTGPAEYLVDLFLSRSGNDLPTHPILSVLVAGAESRPTTISAKFSELWASQIRTTLAFCTTLIRVSMYLDRANSHLQGRLFKATPLLARLYVASSIYKGPVVKLLESLVRSAATAVQEPPSLLGHLGPEAAKNFLAVLSNLDRPIEDEDTEVAIWKLLSAVISSRQQWFSIYLLTGRTPRESAKKKQTSLSRGKPLITFALDQLSHIETLKPRRCLAMLEFVALAQNHWSWAMNDIRSHSDFIPAIIAYLDKIEPGNSNAAFESMELCTENQIAALISDVLAMHLHAGRQVGDHSVLKGLVPKLHYLINYGVSIPKYNASLHQNLKKNLETKFSGCPVSSFKRTLLTETEMGKDYYYDVELANRLLGFEPAWSRPGGYRDEVVKANLNMSLVESQVMMLNSWKLLASELSAHINQEPSLVKSLAKIAADCLLANIESTLPEALFDRLSRTRVELAFVLVQKLVESRSTGEDVESLLEVVWRTITHAQTDFDLAFNASEEAVNYYRSLLKILFLSLQFHITKKVSNGSVHFSQSTAAKFQNESQVAPFLESLLLEILTKVVAKGFRSLADQLHEDPKSCAPADFVLLTAIMQTILRAPGAALLYHQIALQLTNNNTSRYATSLFSWADQLVIDQDPIYGELSVLFLLELSSIPIMAEHLAVEGILSRLSTANIMNYYRRAAGMGPFDDPPRLFSLWSRGILPLCLNLLDAVGAPIAGEVAAFLNQFPNQLARASASLNGRAIPTSKNPNVGNITLSLASELHSLSLISLVLENFRNAGASLGVVPSEIPSLEWDQSSVREDIENWLQGRRALSDRVIATNEREIELTKAKPLDKANAVENRLEERALLELSSALECLKAMSNGSQ